MRQALSAVVAASLLAKSAAADSCDPPLESDSGGNALLQRAMSHALEDSALKFSKGTANMFSTSPVLPLCDAGIVAETCLSLSDGIATYVEGFVSREVIEMSLSTNSSAVLQLWHELGLDEAADVTCSELCEKAKTYLGKVTQLPSSSDRACYLTSTGTVNCSLDVSPTALAALSNVEGDLPAFDARSQRLASFMQQGIDINLSSEDASGSSRRPSPAPEGKDQAVYTNYELVARVAAFFRFYTVADPFGGSDVSLVAVSSSRADLSCADSVNALNAKAKAWTGSVIAKVAGKKTSPLMKKWFGKSDSTTRDKITAVLNQVDQMLGTVVYKLPGDLCTPGIWAYVFQRNERKCCEGGHKVINLCERFCQVSEQEQLETIFHEASHHGEAYLEDIVYGRSQCEAAAKSHPDSAIKNADNFGYYVSDVASGVLLTTTTTVAPTTSVTGSNGCDDNPNFRLNNKNCEGWKDHRDCIGAANSWRWMGRKLKEECPATCQVCSKTVLTTSTTTTTSEKQTNGCVGTCCDKAGFTFKRKTCKQWKKSKHCRKAKFGKGGSAGKLKKNCPATCGVC
eukprot:TRINITY_DN35314_c0_g1_i1.p1 TRINITY_DN35314_c0_g1~~TRINITY_DN35314_c0_g1_i1.p1  ORF type:complete len:569 (-),score=94.03 TRINITY_DN35314_c0_g1_i1:118-1824(-)